jgi:hypothetical protein
VAIAKIFDSQIPQFNNPQLGLLKAELQGIINILQNIQPGTTAYKESQQLLANARKKL